MYDTKFAQQKERKTNDRKHNSQNCGYKSNCKAKTRIFQNPISTKTMQLDTILLLEAFFFFFFPPIKANQCMKCCKEYKKWQWTGLLWQTIQSFMFFSLFMINVIMEDAQRSLWSWWPYCNYKACLYYSILLCHSLCRYTVGFSRSYNTGKDEATLKSIRPF